MMKALKAIAQKDPLVLLRVGLGIVFLLAGLHRIVFYDMAYWNFVDLGLPFAHFLVLITIVVELLAGTMLVLNRKVAAASWMIAALLTVAVLVSVRRAGYTAIENAQELFLLTYTPTNIVLHFTYLIGIVTLLLWTTSRKKK